MLRSKLLRVCMCVCVYVYIFIYISKPQAYKFSTSEDISMHLSKKQYIVYGHSTLSASVVA